MIRDYIKIMRVDHWFKSVFMLPGMVLGYLASTGLEAGVTAIRLAVGVLATCLIASSNYTINEYLDAETDRKHPDKRHRPAAAGRIRPLWMVLLWLGLAATGAALAWPLGVGFFSMAVLLWVMGILYNVRPFRTKERPYLDVVTEAVNNPIRLLLGWYAVGCVLLPPTSMVLSYWMLGAYFMAIKRLAELRHIGDPAVAAEYRSSFRHYTEERLLISIMFYATTFALFTGIFIMRYKVELVLGVPVLAGFMALYLHMGFVPNSPVQYPEKLYRSTFLMSYAVLTFVVVLVCYVVEVPLIAKIFQPSVPQGF